MVRKSALAALLAAALIQPVSAGLVIDKQVAPIKITNALRQDCAANYLAVGTLIDTKSKTDTTLDDASKQTIRGFARQFAERAALVLKLKSAAQIAKPIVQRADALYAPVRRGDSAAHTKLMTTIGTCDTAFKLAPIVS